MSVIDLGRPDYGLGDSPEAMAMAQGWEADKKLEEDIKKAGRQVVGEVHAPNAELSDMAHPTGVEAAVQAAQATNVDPSNNPNQ